MQQAGVALARAARAVARTRQEQFQVQLFELELEAARDAPAALDMVGEILVQRRGELPCLVRRARSGSTPRERTNRLSVSP